MLALGRELEAAGLKVINLSQHLDLQIGNEAMEALEAGHPFTAYDEILRIQQSVAMRLDVCSTIYTFEYVPDVMGNHVVVRYYDLDSVYPPGIGSILAESLAEIATPTDAPDYHFRITCGAVAQAYDGSRLISVTLGSHKAMDPSARRIGLVLRPGR